MRVNFFAPMRLTLAVAAADARARGTGMIVNVSQRRRPARDHPRNRLLRKQVRALRLERGDGRRPARHRRRGQADRARARSTPRSGTSPAARNRSTRGPRSPAEEVADGIIAALGGDRFEHYVPDMKAVVDAKNADIDAYHRRRGRAWRRR